MWRQWILFQLPILWQFLNPISLLNFLFISTWKWTLQNLFFFYDGSRLLFKPCINSVTQKREWAWHQWSKSHDALLLLYGSKPNFPNWTMSLVFAFFFSSLAIPQVTRVSIIAPPPAGADIVFEECIGCWKGGYSTAMSPMPPGRSSR